MKILQESTKYQFKGMLEIDGTKCLGKDCKYYNIIDSTQKEILRQIEKGKITNGMLIRADIQTSGVGTHGRIWQTTKNNITFSFYYELNCKTSKIEGITIEIATLISKILKEKYNIYAQNYCGCEKAYK